MKKLTRKEIIGECDEILKIFDKDSSVNDLIASLTEKEWKRFYNALGKSRLINPDDLTGHENEIRSVAFAMGYLFGTGHLVIFSNKTKKLITTISEALRSHSRTLP